MTFYEALEAAFRGEKVRGKTWRPGQYMTTEYNDLFRDRILILSFPWDAGYSENRSSLTFAVWGDHLKEEFEIYKEEETDVG